MVTAPIYTYHTMVPCHVWQPWVPHVGRMRLLELHGLTGAGVFVAAGATGCAICGGWDHFLLFFSRVWPMSR